MVSLMQHRKVFVIKETEILKYQFHRTISLQCVMWYCDTDYPGFQDPKANFRTDYIRVIPCMIYNSLCKSRFNAEDFFLYDTH